MFYNPYTEKIHNHSNIWSDEEKILAQKGQWKRLFQKDTLMVEIGTGMGNFFSHYAGNNSNIGCVGIELKYKRLYRTYEKCVEKGRDDVVLLRVMGQRIVDIFDEGEIDELYLLFSDPWPKKAHHKHRVIQKDFLIDVAKVISDNGSFVVKTDDNAYADWIREHFEAVQLFDYTMTTDEEPHKRSSPENATEFETIWRSQGKKITAFVCTKRLV